jgi:hypothetical protein
MYVEHGDAYPPEGAAMTLVATKLGIAPETLSTYARGASPVNAVDRPVPHRPRWYFLRLL